MGEKLTKEDVDRLQARITAPNDHFRTWATWSVRLSEEDYMMLHRLLSAGRSAIGESPRLSESG